MLLNTVRGQLNAHADVLISNGNDYFENLGHCFMKIQSSPSVNNETASLLAKSVVANVAIKRWHGLECPSTGQSRC